MVGISTLRLKTTEVKIKYYKLFLLSLLSNDIRQPDKSVQLNVSGQTLLERMLHSLDSISQRTLQDVVLA